jgi:sugar phosphate isomerase/epimerase
MSVSRRGFGRLAAAVALTAVGGSGTGTAGAASRAQAKKAGRVVLGVQSYSFRDRSLDNALGAMKELGFATCELWQGHLEPKVPREELRRWRLETPLETFSGVATKFANAGINLCAYTYSFKDDFTDAEIDRGFAMAKALGVQVITASANQKTVARIAPLAKQHKVKVGLHNHSVIHDNEFATPADFERAITGPGREWMAINLDIGHFTAANFDPVKFLAKHHARVVTLHIKDRKRDQGPNVPFGEGDTPIARVLRLLRDKGWAIPANIEYEYSGLDTVAEVRRCLDYCRQSLET